MKGRTALSAAVGLVVIGVVSANAGGHSHGLGHPDGADKSSVSTTPQPRASQSHAPQPHARQHTGSAGADEKTR
ncbi:hypothetical protein OHB54_27435 [Streptomyces sp. NBC_01007]|nr:hypothetical protein OHB54_27435 [Streptomyces sp. NBC_01007]